MSKGDFYRTVTVEEGLSINVSFSDQLESISSVQVDPPAAECVLLQVQDTTGGITCLYVGHRSLEALILALQQAHEIFYAKF